jgi:hypothetical protein
MSEEKEVTFKVSDRRLFNSDGTLRNDIDSEPEPETPAAVESRPEPVAAAEPAPEPEPEEEAGESMFSEFVMELATNAMMMLGLVEHPQYGRIPPDLNAARHYIDLIGMLKEKTRNNLTASEQRTLEEVLGTLRMQYVGLSQRRPPM